MMALFALFAAGLTVAPLVLSIVAFRRSGALALRLDRLERAVDALAAGISRDNGEQAGQSPSIADRPEQNQPDQNQSDRAGPDVARPSIPQSTSTAQQTTASSTGRSRWSSVPPITRSPAASAEPAARAPASAPPTGIEERLGTRWAVWAGGVALALGGVFLVRYSIDAGLVGPGVRVGLGAILAAALLAAGEWMRRHDDLAITIDLLPQAHIPSVLTATGTVVAFATIYAAHALYGFVGPTLAFVLLGGTAIATMLASAVHGPWLAGLGIAGAFVTPLLISSSSPNVWPVVLYLSVVATASYTLARLRQWLWLAWMTVTGAAVWGFLIVSSGSDNLFAAQTYALLQLILAAAFIAIEPHTNRRDADSMPDRIATLALSVLTVLAAYVAATSIEPSAVAQLFVVLTALALAATAWRSASAASAALLSGAIGVASLIVWPSLAVPLDPTLTAPDALGVLRLPDGVALFLGHACLSSALTTAIAGYRLWRGPLLPSVTVALYAGAVVLTPLLALTVAYLRVTVFDVSIPFALTAALLAIAFAAAAEVFHRADDAYGSPSYATAAGIIATGAVSAFSLALVMALSRGYLTVALAMTAAAAAYVASQRKIRALRVAVAAIGLVVLGRLIYDPHIMGDGVGTTPILNWLLIGYAIPAVAFWFAARRLAAQGDDLALRISESLAIIFAALLGFFQIRHLTNNGDILAISSGHVEAGLQTVLALGLSYATARLGANRTSPVMNTASIVFAASALAISALALGVVTNPYLTGEVVTGRPLFGSLLLAYAVPGLAALFVARHTRSLRPAWYIRSTGLLGVALISAFATLAVRQSFHGPIIDLWQQSSDAEHWAYSAAWLVLGVALLGYGLWRGSIEARAASLGLIVLAAAKITFFDLAGIGGIWRALSFLFLGAVLIGIGLVYQRLVFTHRPPSSGTGQPLPAENA